MKRNRIAAVGLLLVVTCTYRTAIAAGENLVANGTFDADGSGWTSYQNGPAVWSPDDADGSPDSGSVVVASGPYHPDASLTPVRSDCIPVSGASDYEFAAALKMPSRSSILIAATVRLIWYRRCGGTYLGQETISGAPTEWTTTDLIVSAPPDATSAKVYLQVSRDFDNVRSGGVANFDNVVLAPDACGGNCGNPVRTPNEESAVDPSLLTPSDALHILRGAAGMQSCTPCVCDVNDSGDITATDALVTLAAATGAPVSLTCPQ